MGISISALKDIIKLDEVVEFLIVVGGLSMAGVFIISLKYPIIAAMVILGAPIILTVYSVTYTAWRAIIAIRHAALTRPIPPVNGRESPRADKPKPPSISMLLDQIIEVQKEAASE